MQHSKIISGLDIGTSKITTIIGQNFPAEGRFNVVAVASAPADGFRRGQIINLDQATRTMTQSIESAERMAGFQINRLSVSLAASHIESANSHGVVTVSNPNGEITSTDVQRVLDAARATTLPSGKEIIHVIPRSYTVDSQNGIINPLGMNGVRLELEAHLIFASTAAIKNLKKCLEDLDLNIDTPIYSGLAASHSSLTNTERELGVALIDIGGNITTITVFTEGSPSYSAVIPIGSNNVTNDIAIGLRLSLDEAEKIKLKLNKVNDHSKFQDEIDISQFGIISEEPRRISLQTTVNGIVKPRLEEIFNLIKKHLEDSGCLEQIPAGLVITGGGSQTVNLKDICSKIIPLPLRLATPPKLGGVVDEILNPAYSSTIGLLQYCLENSQTPASHDKKTKSKLNGLVGKIKNLLQPLLP